MSPAWLLDLYLMQRFIINWRVWLTDRLTGDWLSDKSYYRGRFIDETIDNPDQRIQHDIDVFTTGTGPETSTFDRRDDHHAAVRRGQGDGVAGGVRPDSVEPVWAADDFRRHRAQGVVLGRAAVRLPRDVVAFWIGRPLIRLSFRNEMTNAAFRYALVRLRDAAEAVGFYRGERAERKNLASRFAR